MCGRLPDSEVALTALGFSTQIVFLLMVAMIGLTVGTVALVARAHGAGEAGRVTHVLMQSTQLTGLVALFVATVGNLLAPWMLRLLGATGEPLVVGLAYLRPLLTGSIFFYMNILYAAVLRGVGNTRLPFAVAIASNVVNIVLNYGFILGGWGFPALGVQGAAYGTVISYAFSIVLMVLLLRRGAVPGITVPLRICKMDRPLIRELWDVGWPAAGDIVILNAGLISIVAFIGRIDEVAVAAHGVGIRVQSLAFVPGMSISQCAGAMIGNALGRGDVEEARRVVRAARRLCTLVMTVLAIVFVALAYPIVHIFDVAPGSALEAYAVDWVRILGVGMAPVGIWIAYAGMLGGAGATMRSLRINFMTTIWLQIPLSWVFGYPLGFGVAGVWAAFPVAFIFKAALGHREYTSGSWTRTGLHA